MGRRVIMLAAALERVGVPRAAQAVRRFGLWPNGGLTILCYHRVDDPAKLDLDPDMVDATPEEFDAQLVYLRRHFRPISLDELLAARRARRPLPADSVLVTFDDGYRDNHDYALPILARHGIKALFFITTGFVTERRVFWWDRIALILRRSQRPRVRIEYPEPDELDLSTAESRTQAIKRMNRVVKDCYGLDLERFLDGLADACGVVWSLDEDRALAERSLMSWKEVRALRAAGMDIGSHTSGHRVLQTLKPDQLVVELAGSRAKLEQEIGEPITTIGYPVGRSIRAFDGVRRAIVNAGYELGFTTVPGVVRPERDDPFDLHRMSVDRAVPTGLARMRLSFPILAR
jgi:peptidoglycan/xylan/chitin deacetylase (PgdA/CDA1 family)